jgi:hypothetical protein
MKKKNKIKGLILMALLIFSTSAIRADEVEKTLAQKKFDVADNALLSIDHQFGKVKCTNWDEPVISVKITATAKAANSETASNLIDRVKFNVEGTRNNVSVATNFKDKIFNNKKDDISIDIEIMMPENIRLDLDHKFGNAYIETVSGQTNISSEYGSIEIKALKNELNNVEIGFGESKVIYLHMGDVEISYSSMTVNEALFLSVESIYSSFSTDKTENLEIENEGGSIHIGEVGQIELSSKFSEFRIDKLTGHLLGETEYGSLNVRGISAEFSEIVIENSFGSVDLNFDDAASFNLKASMEFCNLIYPKNKADFSERIIETAEQYYKGTMGGKAGKSNVIIDSSFGNVSINL